LTFLHTTSVTNHQILAMSEKSSTKQIIKAHGALLKAAESTPITRKILEAYRHTVKYSTNIKAINHTKFSLPQLEKCLQFLKLQTRGTKEEAIYTNKATAADRIILMIESYFPSRCQDCEEVYTNTLTDDTPYPFTCFLCLQGAHSCDESLQRKDKSVECAFNNPVWLCDGCYTKNDLSTPDNPKRTRHPSQCAVTFQGVDKDDPPQDPKVTELAVAAATAAEKATSAKKAADEAKVKAIVTKATNATLAIAASGDTPNNEDVEAAALASETAKVAEDEAAAATKTAEDAEKEATAAAEAAAAAVLKVKEDVDADQQQVKRNEGQKSQTVTSTGEVICDRYRRSVCPHGRQGKFLVGGKPCKFAHPQTCFRYCKYGPGNEENNCNRGGNCQQFHPTLCKYSVKDKLCTDRTCTYIHLIGTKRSVWPGTNDHPPQRYPPTSSNQMNIRPSSRPRDTRQSFPRRQHDERSSRRTPLGGTPTPRQRDTSSSSNSYPPPKDNSSYPPLHNRFGLLDTPSDEPTAQPDAQNPNRETASFLMKFMEEMKAGLLKSQEEMREDFRKELNEFKMGIPIHQTSQQPPLWMQMQMPQMPQMSTQQQDQMINSSMPPKISSQHLQMMPQMIPNLQSFNHQSGF
jgi:hypothetical protein